MGTLVTLVTGASHGLGEATAVALARRGHVVFTGIRGTRSVNASAVERLCTLAAAETLRLHPVELDVTDDVAVTAAVDRILNDTGRIDVVVNNAGTLSYGILEAFTIDQVRALFEVNVLGALRVDRAVLPDMRRRGDGLLVHVTSIGGRLTIPFYGLYCASKYALEALAEAYRYELSAHGVDSVIVEPGLFRSNLYTSMHDPDDHARAEAYGKTTEEARGLLVAVRHMLTQDDALDAQGVAEAIVDLVETSSGKRPLRTVVGDVPTASEINEAAEPQARAMLDALGLRHLAAIPMTAEAGALRL